MKARLIDDVSGTLPPYDQFITLGPVIVVLHSTHMIFSWNNSNTDFTRAVSGLPNCCKQIETQTTVDYLQEMTGFGVAIVDANNLKRVHILAVSSYY